VTSGSPTPPKERNLSIDVLHGLGLLGVFAFDLPMMLRPVWGEFFPPLHPVESGVSAAVRVFLITFVQLKFFTLFALLFGTSLSLLFERAAKAGTDAERPYFRRMTLLFLIGAAIGVFAWYTNVLLLLAASGVLAVPASRWKPPRILHAALISLAGGFLVGTAAVFAGARSGGANPAFANAIAYLAGHEHFVFSHWGFGDLTAYRGALFLILIPPTVVLSGAKVLGCVLLGAWLHKTGRFEQTEDARGFWKTVVFWGAAAGLPSQFLAAMLARSFPIHPASACAQWGLLYFGGLAVASAYIGCVYLLARQPRGARLLAPAGIMGRMGLSNYCIGLFSASLIAYPYGLGRFGALSTASAAALAIPLWTFCLAFSLLWLRRFRFGPLEWFVRGVAYGVFPKMSLDSEGIKR
jgi:uncharacterized protein